ncbi:signal peptidase II [Georgenia sp. TF02-10]|uniref:signal peptidase II n=1 Tax=Georgenia sp. TF02-10 TaxID=2917725 RepID=UPI001FA7E4B0|nr:signal peptidase II [Georgenia sp. TF02-10]UNX55987.1 signal peptidase II [Georgenia sp. TF02-10]
MDTPPAPGAADRPPADRAGDAAPAHPGGAAPARPDGPAPVREAEADHQAPPAAPTPARRRRLLLLLLALAGAVAVVDQLTKHLAEARLEPGEIVPVLGDLLGLQLIYNSGAAFSLATGMTWVFTLLSAVVAVVVVRYGRRLGSAGWAVALGLLLGGCLGNLYDRLFREPGFPEGHVVDFISYGGLFVGNVADIAIVAAAALVAVLALRGRELDGTRAGTEQRDRNRAPTAPERPADA